MASTRIPLFEDEYYVEQKPPTAEEHFQLRSQSGLTPPPRPENEISLQNTIVGITIRLKETNQAVSMGRIIGDGALFLVMVDICTLPNHQKRGLGTKVVKGLLEYCDQYAPNAHLSLLADPPGIKLYKSVGFIENKLELPMIRTTFYKAYSKAQS